MEKLPKSSVNHSTKEDSAIQKKRLRAKYMRRMILIFLIVFGTIFLFNILRNWFLDRYFSHFTLPAVTISSAKAVAEDWTPTMDAVGSLVAINGVQVSPEIPGMVVGISFQSGQMVNKGQSLVQLDTDADQQDLANYTAQLQLAKINYDRQVALAKTNSTSQASLDSARAQYQQAQSAAAKTQILIEQKNIKAPFAGRIGIRNVNLGQYVSPGASLANLQSLDPLYVQFSLPQQNLKSLSVGQPIELTSDAIPGANFKGTITAIDSAVNTQTRNITVQATIPNEQLKLIPGLFVNIRIFLPTQVKVISLPQTAIAFSLFGDSAFMLTPNGKDKDGKALFTVHRRYVTTGIRQGNKVQILKGIKAGEEVVASGQLKLEDGMNAHVNNSVKMPDRSAEELESTNS